MIPLDRYTRIVELLTHSTCSQRRVSVLTGVSRSTVATIKRGDHPWQLRIKDGEYQIVVPYRCRVTQPSHTVALTPCPVCAGRIYRRGSKGRKPGSEPNRHDLSLAPEVAKAAKEIREQGFHGKRGVWHAPWSHAEYRRRVVVQFGGKRGGV